MKHDYDADRAKLFLRLRQEIKDARVVQAMENVPRERFVPPASRHLSYADIPLPIENGQTISQPFIVALMTEALEIRGYERILEIGTGSGYQAAVLAKLARHVITVERHPELFDSAAHLLKRLGYANIEFHPATATLGWPDGAPYDGIIITAGAPRIPEDLIDQLREGGKMVIPVGSRYDQQLLKIIKRRDRIDTINLGGCRFVPLIAEQAWGDQ